MPKVHIEEMRGGAEYHNQIHSEIKDYFKTKFPSVKLKVSRMKKVSKEDDPFLHYHFEIKTHLTAKHIATMLEQVAKLPIAHPDWQKYGHAQGIGSVLGDTITYHSE